VILGARVLGATLRVGIFLAAVFAAALGLLLRSVHADMTESLWGIGAQIMEYPGAPHEAVRKLQLNGVPLSFRTQIVQAPLADVLEHYEFLCTSRDAGLSEQLTSNLRGHSGAPSNPGVLRAVSTQISSNDGAGYVACLDMGDVPEELEELAARFRSFSETGDMGVLGELRYVFARSAPTSSEAQTFLFTMWADSGLHLHSLLPHGGGDAAGRDPIGVPRPSGSQRVLSAWEDRQPSSVFSYHVPATSAAELESFYRRALPGNGWTIIERHPLESTDVDGIRVLFAQKEHRFLAVLAYPGASSRAVLTIVVSEPS
jgi:hypothetical protein